MDSERLLSSIRRKRSTLTTKSSPSSSETGTMTSNRTSSSSSSLLPTPVEPSPYQVSFPPHQTKLPAIADGRVPLDSGLIYFAQNGTYLGPISGTNPDPVTGKVGFNENATLPFQVCVYAPPVTAYRRLINPHAHTARKDVPLAYRQHQRVFCVFLLDRRS